MSNDGTFMGVNSVHYFCCQNELCHFARISNIMCLYLLANIMSYVYANNLRINAFPLSRLPTRRELKHNVVPSLVSPCATSCISENSAFRSQKNQFPLQGSMRVRPPHLSTMPLGRFVHPVVVAAAGWAWNVNPRCPCPSPLVYWKLKTFFK